MCYNEKDKARYEGIMAQKDLKGNMDFIKKNREELLKEHENGFLLVFQKKVVGAFDSYEKAAEEGVRLFGMDANFLVYHLTELDEISSCIGISHTTVQMVQSLSVIELET